MSAQKPLRPATVAANAGRDAQAQQGALNPPVYRASTIAFGDLATWETRMERRYDGVVYGTYGTPTTLALAEAAARIEGGAGAVITSSGLAAVALCLTTLTGPGDHLLVADNVYGPTRHFCGAHLARMGVETTFFDPLVGAGITQLMRPNTRLVYLESPGSFTFEVADLPAIAAAARAAGALTVIDNTWSAGVYLKPFALGADISIQAATKYQSGHGDLVIGWITARDLDMCHRLKDGTALFGEAPGSEECWLTLRGLRSLHARLAAHQAAGLEIATWLADQPGVLRVLHPALPGDPGHELWRRDFGGATSLFGVVLEERGRQRLAAMVDGLELFALGASWGGYQSLILPADIRREARPAPDLGRLVRLHVGLEDPADLRDDLAAGLARYLA